MRLKAYLFFTMVLVLVSCSSKKSTPAVPVAATPKLEIFGVLMNQMKNWRVSTSEFNGAEYGADESFMASNADVYSISKTKAENQTLPLATLITVTTGQYKEFSDLQIVDLLQDDNLSATINVKGIKNQSHEVNINYLTTIATGLTEYNVKANGFSSVFNIIDSAEKIRTYIGFDYSLTSTPDTTDSNLNLNTLSDDVKNSLLMAAISQWTYDVSIESGNVQRVRPYTTIDFITLAYDDVKADGLLDGKGKGGIPLLLGFKAINTNTYRHQLAISLMKYMENNNNIIALKKSEVLIFAKLLNNSISSIFNLNDVMISIDEGGTLISNFLPSDGATISGNSNFTVTTDDLTGVKLIEFFIDDIYYTNYSFLSEEPLNITGSRPFFVPVFQAKGTTGTHKTTVKVTNVNGTITEISNNVIFDNL